MGLGRRRQRWLKDYWEWRISGILAALSSKEMDKMVEWAVFSHSVFPEVVEKIISSPAPSLENTFLYRDQGR
jgi:hypothetical protein